MNGAMSNVLPYGKKRSASCARAKSGIQRRMLTEQCEEYENTT